MKTADIDLLPDVAKNRSSKSREVSLTVYGSESVQGPMELISSGDEVFLPGQTDTFPVRTNSKFVSCYTCDTCWYISNKPWYYHLF